MARTRAILFFGAIFVFFFASALGNNDEVDLMITILEDSSTDPGSFSLLRKAVSVFLSNFEESNGIRLSTKSRLYNVVEDSMRHFGNVLQGQEAVQSLKFGNKGPNKKDDVAAVSSLLSKILYTYEAEQSSGERVAVIFGKFDTHGRIVPALPGLSDTLQRLQNKNIRVFFVGYGALDTFLVTAFFGYGMGTEEFHQDYQIQLVTSVVYESITSRHKAWARQFVSVPFVDGRCREPGSSRQFELGSVWLGFNCVQFECTAQGGVLRDIQCVDAGGRCVPRGRTFQAWVGQKINDKCTCRVEGVVATEFCTP